ncbi:MAG: hypothetical protein IPK80_02705 [Nannocystis sp.]|nr:hypothetical protein [Nannocystis sp.]
MEPKKPIPLTSPDGRVYAWACGQCRRVGGGGAMMRDYDDEIVTYMADASMSDALRCCVCEECGCGLVDKWRKVPFRPLHMCEPCGAAWEAREAERRAALPPSPPDEGPSLCPMCGHPEDD